MHLANMHFGTVLIAFLCVQALQHELRLDGRRPYDFRKIKVQVSDCRGRSLRPLPSWQPSRCPSLPVREVQPLPLLLAEALKRRITPMRSAQFSLDDRQATVQLGTTRVVTAIAAELTAPYPDRPSEGSYRFNVEFSPMASPAFEPGRPGEDAIEVARLLERGLRQSGALDTEALCVHAGRKVSCCCCLPLAQLPPEPQA